MKRFWPKAGITVLVLAIFGMFTLTYLHPNYGKYFIAVIVSIVVLIEIFLEIGIC